MRFQMEKIILFDVLSYKLKHDSSAAIIFEN